MNLCEAINKELIHEAVSFKADDTGQTDLSTSPPTVPRLLVVTIHDRL